MSLYTRTIERLYFAHGMLYAMGPDSVSRGAVRVAAIWLTGQCEWLSGVRRTRPSWATLRDDMLARVASADRLPHLN